MSAVSMKVTPASSAACTVRMAWSSSGKLLSEFIDIGIAPRPIAETTNGPSFLVCMDTRLTKGSRRLSRGRTPGESATDGSEPLAAQLGHLGKVEWCEGLADHDLEHVIGE